MIDIIIPVAIGLFFAWLVKISCEYWRNRQDAKG
jgi:hypothetical protein